MKNYCLLKDVILHLGHLVYKKNTERCNSLDLKEYKNGIYYLDYDINYEKEGYKVKYKHENRDYEEERQACDIYTDVEYIVHTHPLSEYPYPSVEDIWQLVDNPKIELSVIATSWGIYSLKRKGNWVGTSWLKELQQNNYVDGFKRWLQHELDNLGMIHDKKKRNNKDDYTLTQPQLMDVNLYLNNISNNMDIEIKLYHWDYIRLTQY
jgi:hypothetical protein